MAAPRAGARPSHDKLLAQVQRLPPEELCEFRRQFAAWWEQHHGPEDGMPHGEDDLLRRIQENNGLSPAQQRRFDHLRHRQQLGTLSASQRKELQGLWRQVERMNVVRLEALAELARRRGKDVRTVMRELGLPENRDAI